MKFAHIRLAVIIPLTRAALREWSDGAALIPLMRTHRHTIGVNWMVIRVDRDGDKMKRMIVTQRRGVGMAPIVDHTDMRDVNVSEVDTEWFTELLESSFSIVALKGLNTYSRDQKEYDGE